MPLPNLQTFRRVAATAFPVAAGYLLLVAGLTVEYLIVGREIGADGIGALGLAATLCLVLVLAFHAVEMATQTIAARRFGEGDRTAAGEVLDHALALSAVISIPLLLVLWIAAPMLFANSASPAVIELANTYMTWRLPGLPAVILLLVFVGFFNAIGKPVVPAALFGGSLALNGFLGWMLVGGHLGAPRFGMAGAGIAQTVSAFAGLGGCFAYCLLSGIAGQFAALRIARAWRREIFGALAKLAGPVFVQQVMGNLGMFLFALINARVPDDGVSLNGSTIARQIGYATYLPSLGFGIAAASMVGRALGEGDAKKARESAVACWILGATVMISGGMLFVLLREPLVHLFLTPGTAPAVAQMAMTLLFIVAGYQALEAASTILGKSLQGAGETLYVMKVSLVFQWLVFIPLAYILALPVGLGAVGSMLALVAQIGGQGLFYFLRFRGNRWTTRRV